MGGECRWAKGDKEDTLAIMSPVKMFNTKEKTLNFYSLKMPGKKTKTHQIRYHSYKTCAYQTKMLYPDYIELLPLNYLKIKKEMVY